MWYLGRRFGSCGGEHWSLPGPQGAYAPSFQHCVAEETASVLWTRDNMDSAGGRSSRIIAHDCTCTRVHCGAVDSRVRGYADT
eukprot:3163981-Prymnesium_polylepis.2